MWQRSIASIILLFRLELCRWSASYEDIRSSIGRSAAGDCGGLRPALCQLYQDSCLPRNDLLEDFGAAVRMRMRVGCVTSSSNSGGQAIETLDVRAHAQIRPAERWLRRGRSVESGAEQCEMCCLSSQTRFAATNRKIQKDRSQNESDSRYVFRAQIYIRRPSFC